MSSGSIFFCSTLDDRVVSTESAAKNWASEGSELTAIAVVRRTDAVTLRYQSDTSRSVSTFCSMIWRTLADDSVRAQAP